METGDDKRKPALPYGWYPRDGTDIARVLATWMEGLEIHEAKAAVSPHAGWSFSGRLSALAIGSLAMSETIVVVGGHLSQASPILYARESIFETVVGDLPADKELLKALGEELRDSGTPSPFPDNEVDNSVEVLLPMIAHLQPKAKLLWLRCPPHYGSKELGAALGRASATLGKNVTCIGSTDLTHYGPAYGFMPAGRGEKAEKWVKGTNDKAFIDALLDMNCETALSHAVKKASACSAGAAVAALGFALEAGATEAHLLSYATSLEIRQDDSFVGYAAIAFT
ncbi:MAG: AmmeMemoRadiSam system protein B [Candidatus Melainabacteria bacterium HGW-Melainabacteria-1]|nr:MAG: AmmeMemoRadiSam system protein B [Candidatus Melainabacteria bacterium HGW-Melainabacteria-1]